MKKTLITIGFILFITLSLKAQVKTIYYFGDEIMLDTTLAKDYATSFAVYGKLNNDSLYVYKRFDIRNNLMNTGSFKDEALKIPHGKFIYYSDVYTFNEMFYSNYPYTGKNIFIAEEGDYEDGLTVGKWIRYFPDGKIMVIVNFNKGLKEGDFIVYDTKGRVETSGKYLNDKKEGQWIFKNGKRKIYYVNDVKQKNIDVNVN